MKIGSQIDLFVVKPQLFANIMPVVNNGAYGNVKRLCDLLGGFVSLDKAGNTDFGGGQVEIP